MTSRSRDRARDVSAGDALKGVRPHSLQWRRYRAGLGVLASVERLAVGADKSKTDRDPARFAVRRAVTRVEPAGLRRLLDRILDVLFVADRPTEEVLVAVGQYAARLASDGAYTLAIRVHRTTIHVAHQVGLERLLPRRYEQLGWVLREIGDLRAATEACGSGLTAAQRCGDDQDAIRLAVLQGALYRDIGDHGNAAALLTRALKDARAHNVPELVGRAAQERGAVAHELHRYVDALMDYAQAMRACTSLQTRCRLLNDIGRTFHALHQTHRAQETWRVVYDAVRAEPVARWTAGINLMQLARSTGDLYEFDHYRSALNRFALRGRALARYYLEAGAGWLAFGEPASAAHAYRQAATVAKQCGFASELHEATEALRTDVTRRTSQVAPTVFPPPVLELIESLRAGRATGHRSAGRT